MTRPYQRVRYFGVVDETVDADDLVTADAITRDKYQYGGEKVVKFSELYELEHPIPLGTSKQRWFLYSRTERLRDLPEPFLTAGFQTVRRQPGRHIPRDTRELHDDI